MQAAVACAKAGDHASAVAHYRLLAQRASQQHLTHRDLHVCHSNCAASLLALGLHAQALGSAERALALMQAAAGEWQDHANAKAVPRHGSLGTLVLASIEAELLT